MDEKAIDNMSFIFFEDVLSELNHKLTFDAVSGYAGNSFFDKSWDVIMEHHPLIAREPGEAQTAQGNAMQGLASLFGAC